MAISRGPGTEIIRSICIEEVDDIARFLIYGAQHHIYTVLSIIVKCNALNATTDSVFARLIGYDSGAGTTAQDIWIFEQVMSVGDTYVFNDKFSFNGHEPVDFSAGLDVTKQDAIADQGSAVPQKLAIASTHASDSFDVFCTYIDQNNA
tara:strand:- start:205 stop:651 length:447 start_codon:yes stop_codon:yes gene_type:complete